MRHSLDSLARIIQDDEVSSFEDKEDGWLEGLSATQWLFHTRLVLRSAMEVALSVRAGVAQRLQTCLCVHRGPVIVLAVKSGHVFLAAL